MALLPPFQMPGGKRWQRDRIVKQIPPHDIYVEPFIGAGAIFLGKQPAETEVINDKDAEIAFFWRYLRDHAKPPIAPRQWKAPSRKEFERLKEEKPKSKRARFLRFLKLQQFSWRGNRVGFAPSLAKMAKPRARAVGGQVFDQWDRYHARLKGTKIYNKDWEAVTREYDSPQTFFYFDPPYNDPKNDIRVDWYKDKKGFDHHKFARVLKGLKGKWIASYSANPEVIKLFKGAGTRIERYRVMPMGGARSRWRRKLAKSS